MVNLIIKEEYYTYRDLLKEDFVKRWVYGLDKWEKVCEEYTPEMVERISWVPAETIKAAAQALATHLPAQIITSSILNRNDGSVTMLRACAGLVSLLGCVGVPGGGLNLLDNTPPLRSCNDLEEVSLSEKPSVIDHFSKHGIYHAILNENPYPIKAAIWDGNPLAGMANFNRLREALHKMDLCVHLALFPNLTYHYAHAVLPMASWLENDGLVHNSVGRTLQWYNRVLDPPGQCRSFADSDFWVALADRFGWGDRFPWKKEDYSVDARRMTDFFLKQEPLTAGCSVNLLDPEKNPPGGIFWPCMKEEDAVFEDRVAVIRGKGILFKPGEKFPGSNQRFQTDSGKINIASKALHNIGMSEVPTYQEPAESPVLFPELGRKYPLILTTGMPIDFIPQVGYWLSWLRNKQTNLFAQIHPRVAKLLGVSNGDLIVVENDRGETEYPVWASETVDARCIWCPRGTDPYQPFYPYQSIEHLMGEIEGDLRRDRLQSNTAMVRVFKKGTNPQEAVDKLTGFFEAKSR
jgi:anaerobic selenocysteine-containing dehydrogenase